MDVMIMGAKGNKIGYTRLMTVKERIKGIGGLPKEDNEKADIGCNLEYVSTPINKVEQSNQTEE